MTHRRVLVLMHSALVPPPSIEGLTQQEILPFEAELDVLGALEDLGHEVFPVSLEDELHPIREAIEEHRPHVAFNLLTHFHGVGNYQSHVVSYLELLKTPYTGCNPRGLVLSRDKAISKKILSYHRIPTPDFAVFLMGKRVRRPRRLDYPLIVKSLREHSSMGIAQASVVHDDEKLAERVEFIHRTVGTDAIAERFVEGRELTIGVLGNERLTALPPWELTFENLPAGAAPIQTSKLKWDLAYQKRVGARSARAEGLDPAAAEKLSRVAKRIYRALGMSGYARIDLRLTPRGAFSILDVNANCDLCRVEDFASSARSVGLDYPDLVERLVRLGITHRPAWRIE